jgi:predicted NBD/HSP70 family sugar kinase
MGLTPSAITKIVSRLTEQGIVSEVGMMSGKLNRRSIGLKLNSVDYQFIGVKVARNLVDIGVFDLNGVVQSFEEHEALLDDIHQEVESIRARIRQLISLNKKVVAIAIAIPGPYFKDKGTVGAISGAPQWSTINFIDEFSHAFDVPCFLEHDARAGAIAHYLFDNPNNTQNLAYFLVGEGVGCGVIESGRIVDGCSGAASEIGHMSIDVNGVQCICGNRGCLERYCSSHAVKDLLQADYPALIPNIASLGSKEACSRLFQLNFKADPTAQKIITDIGRYVGYGCVNIVNGYNPEEIIIGDIMAGAGELLLEQVRKVVSERIQPQVREDALIRFSRIPTDAILAGAAALAALEFLKQPTRLN